MIFQILIVGHETLAEQEIREAFVVDCLVDALSAHFGLVNQERNLLSRIDPATADTMAATGAAAPLIAHVIYGLKTGGVENGLVNLINHMPA